MAKKGKCGDGRPHKQIKSCYPLHTIPWSLFGDAWGVVEAVAGCRRPMRKTRWFTGRQSKALYARRKLMFAAERKLCFNSHCKTNDV